MKNSHIAFKLLGIYCKPPGVYTNITCHLVFGIKLNMTRKYRYVVGGYLGDVPTHMTYSMVVSRNTVHVGFFVSALNGLDFLLEIFRIPYWKHQGKIKYSFMIETNVKPIRIYLLWSFVCSMD